MEIKFRPQILAAIVAATIVASISLWVSWSLQAIEISTAVIGAMFGYLAGVSQKVLESE